MTVQLPGWQAVWDREPWRSMLCCGDPSTCTNRHHVQQARKAWAEAIQHDLTHLARTIHSRLCTYEIHADLHPGFGGYYVSLRDEVCGRGGSRHIAEIARRPHVIELWSRNHQPAPAPGDELAHARMTREDQP